MLARHLCPHEHLDDEGDCADCYATDDEVKRDIEIDTAVAEHLREPVAPPAPRRRDHARG